MDKAYLKALLKTAKEAIKAKDHEKALDKCKEVLSFDKSNYTALVFSGACYQELGNSEKTVELYRAAIKLSPDLPLAWQGLGSFYEKAGSSKHQDSLIQVYKKLLKLCSSDGTKMSDLYAKLSWLLVHANMLDDCISTLDQWRIAGYDNFNPSTVILAMRDKIISSEQAEQVLALLSPHITEESIVKNKSLICYQIELLHKLARYGELLSAADVMRRALPNSVIAVEWMLRVAVESGEAVPQLDELLAAMDAAEPDNVWSRMCRGTRFAAERQWAEALQLLEPTALGAAGDLVAVHALRGRVQLTVHAPAAAETSCRAALRRLPADPELQLLLAEALVRQGSGRAAEAEKTLLELSDSARRSSLLAEARLRLGRLDAAEAETTATVEVRAQWLTEAGRAPEAVRLLQTQPPLTAQRLRALGLALWSVGDVEESATRFLEAAKLDPHHAEPFYYLGRYYEQSGANLNRVMRCYQKACRLSPGEPRASAALSDLYRRQGEHEANLTLLTGVTEAQPDATTSGWAWFRLGLHHIQVGEYQRAVVCLQTTLSARENDALAWECLGDAYRLRGALTSAVHAYSRVATLTDEPVYALLRMADVRRLLGQLDQAQEGYVDALQARPDYVPALKGLGETHLQRAHELTGRQLHGSARDSCQLAADALSRAVAAEPGVSCLWKELADVMYLAATLPPPYRSLSTAVRLPSADSAADTLTGAQLADAAIRCYRQALTIDQLGGLWHDLAQCCRLRAAMFDEDGEPAAAERIAQTALQCAHNATRLLPTDRAVWNTLGAVACGRHVQDKRLAQHAFIRSLRLEETAMAWTNLACLYLLDDQLELAHQALTKAQGVDPSYGGAWTGQALVAEQLAPEQATDLFRHAVQLQPSPLASLGYGRWVSRALRQPAAWTTAHYRFNIERMQAVTVAGDALALYTASCPADAAAWNLVGILAERQGRRRTALHAYERALALLEAAAERDAEAVDAARVNCARLLAASDRFADAIAQYARVSTASFNSQCGLALAQHGAEQYQQSYQSYETALHWLAADSANKSHTRVAIATMQYRFGDAKNARTQLLLSFQRELPSEQGLLALTALALRRHDSALALACGSELAQRRTRPELAVERALLEACLRLEAGDRAGAVRVVQSGVHRWPNSWRLWRLLAACLIQLRPDAAPAAVTAAAAAAAAHSAGHSAGHGSHGQPHQLDDLVCATLLRAGAGAAALRAAQRAVLRRPDSGAAWCDLVAARLRQPAAADKLGWLRAAVTRLRRGAQLDRPLVNWLSHVERRVESLTSPTVHG